jgi:hypothetical protein
MTRRNERCAACGKPTYVGEDFDGPCVDDTDLACALRQRDEAVAVAVALEAVPDLTCALRERDEARAEVARLTTELDKAHASAARGWEMADSLHLSIPRARREGAKAMREAAVEAAVYYGNITTAERIRALPLPGDKP